jgi:ribosomal protein S27AE
MSVTYSIAPGYGPGFTLDESVRIREALFANWTDPLCPRCGRGSLEITRGGNSEEIALVKCSPCGAFVMLRHARGDARAETSPLRN